MAKNEDPLKLDLSDLSIGKYESPEGLHRHKCKKCKFVWEHQNSCMGDSTAHECPNCGKKRWTKYFGKKPPTKNES